VTEKKAKKEIKENIIEIPTGVTFTIDDSKLVLEKASVVQEVPYNHVYISLEKTDGGLKIIPNHKKSKYISVSNTLKKIILNTIEGFDRDFICKMQIVYSHFPLTVKIENNKFVIVNFYGEKKNRTVPLVEGVKVEISGKDIVLSGNNKQKVGQLAGSIESIARLKNKDYRVFDDGIYIVEKAK
jgi:large subunit ribosomal protein L6